MTPAPKDATSLREDATARQAVEPNFAASGIDERKLRRWAEYIADPVTDYPNAVKAVARAYLAGRQAAPQPEDGDKERPSSSTNTSMPS